MSRGELQRFTYLERLVHWAVGLSFVFLLLTGLAFSHPRLFWLTTLVGGGPTARILHPWIGMHAHLGDADRAVAHAIAARLVVRLALAPMGVIYLHDRLGIGGM